MKRFTIQEVLDLNLCPEYRDGVLLKRAFGRKKYMPLIDVTDPELQKIIKPVDLIWFLTRPDVLPKEVWGLWIADCTEHVLKYFEKKFPKDKRPQKAIETIRAYYKSKATAEDLRAAWAAARDAAWAAAWAAANAAECKAQADIVRKHIPTVPRILKTNSTPATAGGI